MNNEVYVRMDSDLRLSGRAEGTREHYLGQARRFFRYVGDRDLSQLEEADVRAYLHSLLDRGLSPHSLKMAIAALKLLFGMTLGRPEVMQRIPYPKIKTPPAVIPARSELRRLFQAAPSPLHRVACMTAYGAGLRVSEVTRLTIRDIDSARNVIHVREGKGGKDRVTVLSAVLLEELRAYWAYTRPPAPWLFAGDTAPGHVSVRYLHSGFKIAVREAHIRRPGLRFHSLRHGFATHLLEDGVDIRVIQALLGHASLKATMRYTQVRADHIAKLNDPLEFLAESSSS
ncbi:MAG: tyrosine-type recombinase/integrase [bacterium]|nr:tyrosine-type recombinase/integrase [bacterium]